MERERLRLHGWWAAALFLLVACESADTGPSGALSLDLVLRNGATIDEVNWRITGGRMPPMAGVIDTSAPGATTSVEVFGIPASNGYLITLDAASEDGETTCVGSAPFDVAVGVTTEIHVMLHCQTEPRSGATRVNARFEFCAALSKVVVSPLQTSIGNDIDLWASASDNNGDPVEYRWVAAGGRIDNPSAQRATFTCEEEGDGLVTVTVSDDGFMTCIDDWSVHVTCIERGGTGGTGGNGGSGGSGFPAAPELEDGPNMSGVYDPLAGERSLLAQDDLLYFWQEGEVALTGVPMNDGVPVLENSDLTTNLATDGSFVADTRSARLFNVAKDYSVTVWSPKTETVTVDVEEWIGDGTSSSKFAFQRVFPSETVSFASDVGGQLFALVDDFDLDGLDDVLISPNLAIGTKIATAVDVDDPSQGLTYADVAGSLDTSEFNSWNDVTTADLNGDSILELVMLKDCKNSTTTGPTDNRCEVVWVSICPGPVAGTACATADSGWTFLTPQTFLVTVEAPSGQSMSQNRGWIAAGGFLNNGSDQVAVLLPLVSDNIKTLGEDVVGDRQLPTVYLYSFSDSFVPTKLGDKVVFTGTATECPIAAMAMDAAPIFWGSPKDMMAVGVWTLRDEIAVLAYWAEAGELQSVSAQGPGNASDFYGVAAGHFDRPITGCGGEGTSCPESQLNFQMAHLLQTDNNQTDLFVWDVTNAGDPGCASTANPPFCLSLETHPKIAGAIDKDPIKVIAGDFRGRGIRLGAPIVTRQTVNRPAVVLATPPAHGERLRVQDFDQNLFPTSASTPTNQQAWIAASSCDTTTFADIDGTTTCTFDFTIDGNTGNSQYQSLFKETATNSSMSTTDHHFATSWGGSSTTSVSVQASDGPPGLPETAYANASATVSVGRTNTTATDNINGTYTSNTQTSTFATSFDDTVVYITATQNVYRYPMLGQTCSPSGGNNGCTAERTGLQYYTMEIPNQPTTTKSQGKVLEWFQPPWVPGNILTYPANCAALAGMYEAGSNINNPLKTDVNDIGGGDGSFSQEFMSTTTTTSKTANGHSIYNDDTVSVTAGIGCTEKPGMSGAKVSETGNFQDTRDRSTLTSSTTTTTGSSEVITNWTDALNWMQSDQFVYSSQLIVNGLTSSFASPQIQSISTDPVQGADPSDTYVVDGFFSSAYTVGFDEEKSEWWLDTNKTDYYSTNIDVSLALPGRLENTPGGTQPGEGDEALTQCMDNGASQKLQCVRMSAVDTSFTDVWGVCGDYFHMRGFFFSPAPSASTESMQSCSTQADCPFGEACVSGTCGQCTLASDCETGQTCANSTCIRFVNGLPSVPGGTTDTVIDGTEVLLGVRVYNTSLMGMAQDDKVRVQIYGQKWDGEKRATDATGNPIDSFLVGGDTIELAPISGFPTSGVQDSCDPDDAVYNWSGAFTTWDTSGLAPSEAETFVFWVLAWAEDSSGNVVAELPDLGLCPEGACAPCPLDGNGNPKCTWMTDVNLQPWSNNLGLYRKVFTVLPPSASEPQAPEVVRRGGVFIDGLDLEGVRRVGDRILVRARLRAEGGPANGVTVAFFDDNPSLGEAVDHEVVSYVPEGDVRPVSISYMPAECGPKTIFVEARDDQGFVTRASRPLEIPCEESRIGAERNVEGNEIPREGRWDDAGIVLRLEGVLDVALPTATLVLERVFYTVGGEELVRTENGDALNGVVLSASEHASADDVIYRGSKDGSQVEAIVKREGGIATIVLTLEGAHIRPGLFCGTAGAKPKPLRTQISLVDGVRPRALVTARDGWTCGAQTLAN